MKSGLTSWVLLLTLGVAAAAGADVFSLDLSAPEATPALERSLVLGLAEIRRGDLPAASERLERLVEQQPDFRLAHLIRGDLYMAQATGLAAFGHGITERDAVPDLLFEARARWTRYKRGAAFDGLRPQGLLRVPDSAPSVLAIDLLSNRLFVFERDDEGFRKTRDFYVSIGKGGTDKQVEGDERTPVGYYLVSEYLDGKNLPDLYGVGAFPITYPNGWDRILGRTGSGIWIHGTESTTYSRPPRSSLGCVTLSNQDFSLLMDSVSISETPVLVTNGFDWVPEERIAGTLNDLESHVESWRQAWESRDVGEYLSFYSDSFRTLDMTRDAFGEHKRRVNAGKKFIRVALDDIGIYAYPGEPDLVIVDFVQRYESDTFKNSRRKHQYWRREGETWRIVFEESV